MMGKVIMSGIVPPLVVPSVGIALSTLAEGSIVKLNENGATVEFYVAKHDYESGLNGAGRTLLVRKDCYDQRNWHSSQNNAYATSDFDSWLNGDYKGMLDANVQSAIGSTVFYYTKSGSDAGSVTTLQRSVFALSLTELGASATNANVEGTALPTASALAVAYLNGSSVPQWTRTPYKNSSYKVYYLSLTGVQNNATCTNERAVRPCFTLPATALFDEETLLFKGVS